MVSCKWDIDVLCAFGWSNMVDGTYVGMFLKPSTFGAKWVKTYAKHSAIICEAFWHWPKELTISFILMGRLFGVVLPIHIHIMDPIYVELPLRHCTHQEREGPPLAMMLVGTPKVGLNIHIHQWFWIHLQFGLFGRRTQGCRHHLLVFLF